MNFSLLRAATGALLVTACLGAVACGSDSGSAITPGGGGSGGSETGGSAGSATGGSAGSSTGGSAGSATGGSAGSATGGSAGSATGGSAGSSTGGSAGSATGGSAGSSTGGFGGDDGGLGGTGGSSTGGFGGDDGGLGGTGGYSTGGSGGGDGGTCTNACTENVSQCVGAQVQVCAKQANGCTDWNTAQSCPNNQACNAGSCPTCTDKCTENISQCVGAQVQTCGLQANGCTDWNTPQDCANNKACNAGACPTCTDNCTHNATQCNGSKVQQCQTQPDGCTDWATPTDCPYGKPCVAGACPTCIDKCVLSTAQCNGAQLQTCSLQPTGCTDWDTPANCPNNKACIGNACPSCSDSCTLNNTQCNGTQLQSCTMQSTGCTNWDAPQTCASGKACVNGACPTCTDACVASATKCSGSQIQTCATQATGCTDWSAAADCLNNGICQANQCVTACTPNTLRCNGALLETCTASHQWMTQQVCAQSCDTQTLQCVSATACASGARRCSSLQSQVCNSTGTAWLNVESCLVACDNGLCTGACTPNAKRCNGQTPETCNATGTAWAQGSSCSTYCYKGQCAESSLTIDADANKTLEGEHFYDGDVIIKNSSVLTSTTGRLIIHAKNVILDASSKIVITPMGDEARGRGADGRNATCGYSCTYSGYTYYYTSSSTLIGGGGGGFGVSGSTASTYGYPGSGSCASCTVSSAGGAVYAIADDELAMGSSGGACNGAAGGKGGGYFAIFADSITLQGQVTANGQNATGCAGGGSGGEVLLRATNDLQFTGSISVAGGLGGGASGAGNGGNGVVKLLYGNTKSTTGSIIGAQFASFMPPNDLASATHPRPDLWYNDGYTSLDIAWSKPFTASAGYYRKQNVTYGFVPNSSNANYQSGEAISYLPADLTVGTNYFHLSTLGPFATMGIVESRYIVNVNSTPPAISSSSHGTQTTWYANDSPYLTWTLPKADNNTTNFYWAFDRFLETLPGTADNKIPMDLVTPQNSKQILLPGKANGIWFFHLISQDTMGYLTKQAALFRVQIGTDPGKGSVSGTVTDGKTNAFLQNVQISLNRGVHTAATNASGAYALSNSVYAQSYEVRARLTGYTDGIQNVTVTAAQTSTVNFILQPQ